MILSTLHGLDYYCDGSRAFFLFTTTQKRIIKLYDYDYIVTNTRATKKSIPSHHTGKLIGNPTMGLEIRQEIKSYSDLNLNFDLLLLLVGIALP